MFSSSSFVCALEQRTAGCAMFVLFVGAFLTGSQRVTAASTPDLSLHGLQNAVIEWGYTAGGAYEDPFNDVTLDVVVTAPDGREMTIPAFWAGGAEWRVRFSSPETGTFHFRTVASNPSDKGLHDQTGKIVVRPYEGDNCIKAARYGLMNPAASSNMKTAHRFSGWRTRGRPA